VPPIEVKLAGAVLRIVPGTDAALLTTVLRAVRASAT
jgi:transposase